MKTILKLGGVGRRLSANNGSAEVVRRAPVRTLAAGGRVATNCAGLAREAVSKAKAVSAPFPASHRTPCASAFASPVVPSSASLANTHGFWELTLFGQRAAVPHHPALYFVAWLLGNAPAKPVSALELAARVFVRYQAHDDLLRSLPWLCRQQGDADVKKVLDQKQRKLEKILDDPEAPAAVKAEAQQEIIFIEHLRITYFAELLPPGTETASRIWNLLLDLNARLAGAVDAQGRPHEVMRALGRHLLLRVVMPSVRASRSEARFVYERPE